jgi:large subunit ribosomal protein L2
MLFHQSKFFINRIKKNLLIGFSKRAGRNFFGRKTVLTQSGGLFKKTRIINFKRNLKGNAILLTIEKDIDRTAFISLICFENGLICYILLFDGDLKIGELLNGFSNSFVFNTSSFLLNIPTGNFVHHIEMKPGTGGILTRAAGCSSFLISEENNFVFLKMNSR